MKLITLFLVTLVSIAASGQRLTLAPYQNVQYLNDLCKSGSISVHYAGEGFFIATATRELPDGAFLLKENPWDSDTQYFLVWLPEAGPVEALVNLQEKYPVLYSDRTKSVVGVRSGQSFPTPFIHGGVIRISEDSRWMPRVADGTQYVVDTFPMVYDLMAMVDTGEFMPDIQHLEDYGTRFCESIKAIQAQEWIQGQFEQYPGLEVVTQNFPYYGNCSDNVIATLPGTLYPDEYIVVGAHYDSYSFYGDAPGADDNASGTAAVLELARILSQYQWDRSIVFCAFSGEEVGLLGSEYYASQAQSQGMNILGYFNFDMIGYRHGLDPIHTDMIAPPSALELVNFYKDVVAIYLPDFDVYNAQLSGGDSDHTSFNNNGYMGIFPFEDVPNYSPYIHTPQDLIGPSVNSPEMAATFIQANLASVATLSVPYDPVGINEERGHEMSMAIYPNPATDKLSVLLTGTKEAVISIFSATGHEVLQTVASSGSVLNVSSLAAGVYAVSASSGDRTVISRLVIIPAF